MPWLKDLWKYERKIHEESMRIFSNKFHLPPIAIAIVFIPALIGLLIFLYFESWETAKGQIISLIIWLTLILIIYLSVRVFAPVQQYNKSQKEIESFKEYIRPKLSVILKKGEYPFLQINPYADKETKLCTYRMGLINNGLEKIINIQVKLDEIEPYPPRLRGNPFNLHFMNDNIPYGESQTYKKVQDLPSEDRLFIGIFNYFIHINKDVSYLQIWHTVRGIDGKIPIQPYKIKLIISSDNGGRTLTQWFKFDPNKQNLEDVLELIN